jgi:hypothetical protein
MNVSIEVLQATTWHYTTSYTEPVNFSLLNRGELANITIYNTGNMPLNFTLKFLDDGGSSLCSSFGEYTKCIDYSKLQGGDETGSFTAFHYVDMNSSSTLLIYQDVELLTGYEDVGVIINISNNQGDPKWNTTRVEFNILDKYPILETKIFSPASKNVEFYKHINMTIDISDDVVPPGGVNESEFRINITKPDNTKESYSPPLIDDLIIYDPFGDLDRFFLEYNNTNVSGQYNITIIAKDSGGKYVYFYDNFTVIPTTNISITTQTMIVDGVTQDDSSMSTITINAQNLGIVTAYNINLTGEFSNNASTFYYSSSILESINSLTIKNITLNITVPEKTNPGTYYFTPNLTWVNPDLTITTNTFPKIKLIVSDTHKFEMMGENKSLIINHSKYQITNFTLDATGNLNETNISISSIDVSPNINIEINPFNLSNLIIGGPQTITLNVSVDTSTPPGIKYFTILVNNSGYQTNYTANVTIPTSNVYQISHEGKNLTIQGVADVQTLNQEIWIKSYANIDMPFAFDKGMGDLTTYAEINPNSHILTPNENYTIKLNYLLPKDNLVYSTNISINDTTIPIKMVNHYYDLNIISVTAPSQVLTTDTIGLELEIVYGDIYINNQTTFVATIGDTNCLTTTFLNNSNNKTYLQCTAPTKTDGTTHQVNVIATYNDSGTIISGIKESDTPIPTVYYKDLTPPNITGTKVDNAYLNTNTVVVANVTDNVEIDTVKVLVYDSNQINIINYTMNYVSGNKYDLSFKLDRYGYYYLNYLANDTTGNDILLIKNDSAWVYGELNWSGNTKNEVPGKKNPIPLMIFNLSKGDTKIDFSTDINGDYGEVFNTDYYNTLITLTNPLNFDGTDFITDNIILNFTNADYQEMNNTDFIDMYYLYNLRVEEDNPVYDNLLRGFAIRSKFSSTVKIEIPFYDIDLLKLIDRRVDWATKPVNMKIHYCDSWNYTSSISCKNGWETLNTWVEKHGALDAHIARAELNKKISGDAAFILAAIDENVGFLSTPQNDYGISMNHGDNTIDDITIYSTGSSDIMNLNITCEGEVCEFIQFPQNYYSSISESSKIINMNVTIPLHSLSSTYEGEIVFTHKDGQKKVTYTIEIYPDTNCTATIPKTYFEVGSLTNNQLTNITLTNEGNTLCTLNLSTSNTNLTLFQNTTTLNPDTSIILGVDYQAPKPLGLTNHQITITGQSNINLEINVTHKIDNINVSQLTDLYKGIGLTILMNATGPLGTETNVTWNVTFGNTPCSNINYVNNTITCTAPLVSKTIYQEMIITGNFQNGTAREIIPVIFIDQIPPHITNIGDEVNINTPNPSINATLFDDTGISNVSNVYIKNPDSTITQLNYQIIGNQIAINLTNITVGYHTLAMILKDTDGATSQEYNYSIEIYQPVTLSGTVDANIGGTLEKHKVNFTFKKQGTNEIKQEFSTDNLGVYTYEDFHDTNYDVDIKLQDIDLTLYNTRLSSNTDLFNFGLIDLQNSDQVVIENPVGRNNDLWAFYVDTKFNFTNGTLRMFYHPNDYSDSIKLPYVHVLKCDDFDPVLVKCNGLFNDLNASKQVSINNNLKYVEVQINSFSAYALSEFLPAGVTLPTNLASVTSAGSGGGAGGDSGWSEGISESNDLKNPP